MHRAGFLGIWSRSLCFVGLVLAGLVAAGWWARQPRARDEELARLPKAPVRRSDLFVNLSAPGRVETVKKTLIECELENLTLGSEGTRFSSGGTSQIIEIIPEGTTVHQNDIMCRLDSTVYEELVRSQEIKVEQSRAERLKAKLDVEAAELALEEFRLGTKAQEDQALTGETVLAQSDIRRQGDRMAWAEKMTTRGYLSEGQLVSEKDKMLRAEIALSNLRGERSVFDRYGVPAVMRKLEITVETSKSTLAYQNLRVRRREAQLEKFRRQVDHCTIRAPHDGFVLYANEPDGDPRVELGSTVYEKMDLFYLPDLANLQIHAQLHETIVDRVKKGMSVRVRVEGLPEYSLEGHVMVVEQLPMSKRGFFDADVKNYLGRIQLHSIPNGMLPGMSAKVDIQTAHATETLMVPSEAVTVEKNHDYCYVATEDHLERREVTLGQATPQFLEITSGLKEGEEVILDPTVDSPAVCRAMAEH